MRYHGNYGFHFKDGWFFRRMREGSVLITLVDEKTDGQIARIAVDPSSWASIIAAVSAKGDTGENWNIAKKLHEGKLLECRSND